MRGWGGLEKEGKFKGGQRFLSRWMRQRESAMGGPEAGSISESNKGRCCAGPGGRLQLFLQLTAAAALRNEG